MRIQSVVEILVDAISLIEFFLQHQIASVHRILPVIRSYNGEYTGSA